MPDQSAEMAALAAALAQNAGAAPELSGAGSPEGARAAPVGTCYTDIAGTMGAWRWQKRTGSGNTGWVCIEGDTGWRTLAAGDAADTTNWDASQIRIKRTAEAVYLTGYALRKTVGVFGGIQDLYALPPGFRLHASTGATVFGGLVWSSSVYWPVRLSVGQQTAGTVSTILASGLTGAPANWAINDRAQVACSFSPATAWPTTLPGAAS